MEIIPAIDLMNGKVVRLVRGEPATRKSYESLGEPVTVARKWESEGATLLHVVDLDATLGLGTNKQVIKEIVKGVSIPVQAGGGIRSFNMVRDLLSMGLNRVMLGSLAFEAPSQVKLILEDFRPDRVVIALDHLDGRVMARGWRTPVNLTLCEAVSKFSSLGVKFFLVTSVDRDGTLMGPDINALSRIIGFQGAYIMAAGGISSLEDLIKLKKMGVYGAVVGTALYEGKIRLREAIETIK